MAEVINIRLRPPDVDLICINTDGALKGGIAGCGGVFRNDKGEWICGFSKCVGRRSVCVAKLYGNWKVLLWLVIVVSNELSFMLIFKVWFHHFFPEKKVEL